MSQRLFFHFFFAFSLSPFLLFAFFSNFAEAESMLFFLIHLVWVSISELLPPEVHRTQAEIQRHAKDSVMRKKIFLCRKLTPEVRLRKILLLTLFISSQTSQPLGFSALFLFFSLHSSSPRIGNYLERYFCGFPLFLFLFRDVRVLISLSRRSCFKNKSLTFCVFLFSHEWVFQHPRSTKVLVSLTHKQAGVFLARAYELSYL